MTYTGVVFSLKSGFNQIVLTQELILVLNQVSQKYCFQEIFLYHLNGFLSPLLKVGSLKFLKISNPCGKVMERGGLRFGNFY